jgi:parvulin-like peptidyl-prolyl isomerase
MTGGLGAARSAWASDALALALGLALAACGGASAVSANATDRSATVAAKASDPRENDVTAARPTGMLPTTSSSGLALGGAATPPAPAGSAAAPTGPAPEPPAGEIPKDAPKKIGARHVLIQWMGADQAGGSVVRTKEQALAVAQEVLRRARAGEDLGRLAVEYSDEPGAAQRGGSLGRFGRGKMVPAFENAAFRLKVGEISGIVESPFGYHIIQRTE